MRLARIVTYGVLAIIATWVGTQYWISAQVGSIAQAAAAPQPPGGRSWAGSAQAPEFPGGLDWINVEQPLTMEGLKGKVVLYDFWTYGCVNCLHVIPDLKYLEDRYEDELVVIGIHTAKFQNEGVTAKIREFVRRHERSHPVVNDRDYTVWREWGIRAWPTLVVIDPAGNIVGKLEGEGHREVLDEVIGSLVAEFDARDMIDRAPIPLAPVTLEPRDLAFPAKLLVLPERDGLLIADTSQHRLVLVGLDGRVRQVFGGRERGFADGGPDEVRFDMPRGMALGPDGIVYIADTQNHSIRSLDLDSGRVETVLGSGAKQYQLDGEAGPDEGLNSPWDLLYADDHLYIAMAGQHQVWRMDLATGRAEAWVGSRREALTDGPRRTAGMNQPSGLTTDGTYIYVADSEASAVRRFDEERIDTLVGTGLFDFGDRDGVGDEVLLQHALGVAHLDGGIYIVDTYNSKLKLLDPDTRRVTTVVAAGLDEPGGLAAGEGRIYIADTNAHRVRVYDPAADSLRTLELDDPDGLLR